MGLYHSRSEWSQLSNVKAISIKKHDKPISGHIRVPGSKSLTNRALILAAAAHGDSVVAGILRSDDSYWCIDALRKLGVDIQVDGDTAYVKGCGGAFVPNASDVFIGSAGTTARFLPGILASSLNGIFEIHASQQLMERPIAPLVDALRTLGARIEYIDRDNCYPIRVFGKQIAGGSVSISGKLSSQFISGLLMASPLAEAAVHIHVDDHIVQHAYVHLTIDLMRAFGVAVEHDANLTLMTTRPDAYQATDIALEADASTAGYFLALAALTGGTIRITNLGYGTSQPDIHLIDIFEQMGCRIVRNDDFVELTGPEQLKGGFTVSMKEMSDQTLTLAAVAVFADRPVTITDVAHIRKHESDRIHAMYESLKRLSIEVVEHEDGLTISPGTPMPAVLETYDDHRLAMSLSLVGAKAGGVTLLDPGCVSKTCPSFFDDIQNLGVPVDFQLES